MAEADRVRWDERYESRGLFAGTPELPDIAQRYASALPAVGTALDLACGTGAASVAVAKRGLDVLGVDVSPEAIGRARHLAARHSVEDRCSFVVADLDDGLPDGPSAHLIICHRFRDPALYPAIVDRLAPGGVLVVSVLSEVGASPGRFRAQPGELEASFSGLNILGSDEADGAAWLVATRDG